MNTIKTFFSESNFKSLPINNYQVKNKIYVDVMYGGLTISLRDIILDHLTINIGKNYVLTSKK